jgi:hypothetical protein
LVLLLAACVEEPATPPIALPGALPAAERAACEAGGGRVGRGAFDFEQCIRPTPDAGKTCTKPSDCSAGCLAETKTCVPESPMFGCREMLMENGGVATLCVD